MRENEEEREKRLDRLKKFLDNQAERPKFLPRRTPTIKIIAEEPEPQIKSPKICRSCGATYTLSKVADPGLDPGLCVDCYLKKERR